MGYELPRIEERKTDRLSVDILFCDHPVAKQLVNFVENNIVKHLKLRLHDGACVFPSFGQFLNRTFEENQTDGIHRTITFTLSCSCPNGCPHHPADYCFSCGWRKEQVDNKPIEEVTLNPACIESCMERMMDMQDDLFHQGILPPKDDDEEEVSDDMDDGPYKTGRPVDDDYEEKQPAFHSGLYDPLPMVVLRIHLTRLAFSQERTANIEARPRHRACGPFDRARLTSTSNWLSTTSTWR